jgi:hypothetical protein
VDNSGAVPVDGLLRKVGSNFLSQRVKGVPAGGCATQSTQPVPVATFRSCARFVRYGCDWQAVI